MSVDLIRAFTIGGILLLVFDILIRIYESEK